MKSPAKRDKAKLAFDPKVFLRKVSAGVAVSNYRKGHIIYTQGASAVFYIQSGKVKKTVLSVTGQTSRGRILWNWHIRDAS